MRVKKQVFFKRGIVILLALVSILILPEFNHVKASPEENRGFFQDEIFVISMGDSYSSGEGLESYFGQDAPTYEKVENEDWLAHRSENAWPGKLKVPGLSMALAEYHNENWFFVATSGAETEHLYTHQQKQVDDGGIDDFYYVKPQLAIFNEIGKNKVDYITITLGGNNLGFADIIKKAVLSSPIFAPNALSKRLNKAWKDFYDSNGGVRDKLKQAYFDISEQAGPQAKIIVAGYPRLLDAEGGGLPFRKSEAEKINTNVTLFNEALRLLVSDCRNEGMNIYFSSVEEGFYGHEAYSDKPFIHPICFVKKQDLKGEFIDKIVSKSSVHPNKNGAQKYCDIVQTTINSITHTEFGLDKAVKIKAYSKIEEGQEFLKINGINFEKDVVWTKEFSKSLLGQSLNYYYLGARNGYFYYIDLDNGLYKCRISDGEAVWICPEAKLIATDATIDDSGNLYILGFIGTNFVMVDSEGKIAKRIESFSSEYYWPSDIELKDNELFITFDMSPTEDPYTLRISLPDFEYSFDY
ncbi:MAG TPA: hypothetical protein GXZ43_03730 [Clostridiaceae bacterium]|nr:hypothetical protein [Clostridiaceae bacterium]